MTNEAQASLWEGKCQDTRKQPTAKSQGKPRSSAVHGLRPEQNNEEIHQAEQGNPGALVSEKLDTEG